MSAQRVLFPPFQRHTASSSRGVTAGMLDVVVGAPEILLALGGAREPRGQHAALDLVRPEVLVLLVGGLDAVARHLLHDPHDRVEHDVADDAGDQAVRDRVREGHDGDGQECRHRVADVPPVDVGGGFGPVWFWKLPC